MNSSNVLAIIALIIGIICALQHDTLAQNRIVGGSETTIQEFPHAVSLFKYRAFACAGSLVSARYVVTAAHCIYSVKRKDIIIVGGATQITAANAVRRRVAKMMIPKDFRYETKNADIGVVKMAGSMAGPQFRYIGLCNSPLAPGQSIRISGWGAMSEESGSLPENLRTVSVSIVRTAVCRARYRSVAKVTKSMFCAAAQSKDACRGDSGGGAIVNGQLCGIISWGLGCARPGYPGVLTNVNVMKPFILRAMRN